MITIDFRRPQVQFLLVVLGAIFAMLILLHKVYAIEGQRDLTKPHADDHVRGSTQPKVIIYEFSDYECPFCVQHHETMKTLVDRYGDDIAWVYKHFPLPIHPQAQTKAMAAECIAQLVGEDAFWLFTDDIFASGTDTSMETLQNLAVKRGVEKSEYMACLNSEKISKIVASDSALGTSLGVQGTPGNVIVNVKTGERRLVFGALTIDTLEPIITSQL